MLLFFLVAVRVCGFQSPDSTLENKIIKDKYELRLLDSTGVIQKIDTIDVETMVSCDISPNLVESITSVKDSFYRYFIVQDGIPVEYHAGPWSPLLTKIGWLILPTKDSRSVKIQDSSSSILEHNSFTDTRNCERMDDSIMNIDGNSIKVRHYRITQEVASIWDTTSAVTLDLKNFSEQMGLPVEKIGNKTAFIMSGIQMSVYLSDSPPYLVKEVTGFSLIPKQQKPYLIVTLIK